MNDPSDPALARWYDGQGWTDHTMVKAEWAGSGPPPPPIIEEDLAPAFAPVAGSDLAPPPPMPRPGLPPQQQRFTLAKAGDRYRAWPLWGRIAAPAAIVFLLIGAFAPGDDKEPEEVNTEPAAAVTLDQAVDLAQAKLDAPIADRTMREVVQNLCDVEVDDAALAASATSEDAAAIGDVIDAAGKGAGALCPQVAEDHPNLVNQTYAAAMDLVAPSSTTATTLPVTTLAPEVTQPPATTTKATTPATTPATTKPTTAPITSPPATDPPSSGVYYANCTAAKNAGAAPILRGEPGYRAALDRDDDGVACET